MSFWRQLRAADLLTFEAFSLAYGDPNKEYVSCAANATRGVALQTVSPGRKVDLYRRKECLHIALKRCNCILSE